MYKILKLKKTTSLPKGGRAYSQFVVKDLHRAGSVVAVHESVYDRLRPENYLIFADGQFLVDEDKVSRIKAAQEKLAKAKAEELEAKEAAKAEKAEKSKAKREAAAKARAEAKAKKQAERKAKADQKAKERAEAKAKKDAEREAKKAAREAAKAEAQQKAKDLLDGKPVESDETKSDEAPAGE